MKIAHLCLSCFYYDNFSYQENLLVQQNVKDGHEVIVIASRESIDSDGKMCFQETGNYIGSDNALVYRVDYNHNVPKKIQNKVRSYEGILKILNAFKPDIIYFHGISAFELLTLKAYKSFNPKVKIIVDVHSDKNNSATNWQSRYLLHKMFYIPIFKAVQPDIEKVFCCSLEAMDFAIDFYGASKDKIEFYPLGGFCLEDTEYNKYRKEMRKSLNVNSKIMLLQTGKINSKKKAVEALKNFIKVKNDNLVYVIAGTLEDDVKLEMLSLIESDTRIKYLGWVSSNQIQALLCACDIYVQPGSQSATMQQALCSRCPVILDDVKSHQVFVKNNGWLIQNSNEMEKIFQQLNQSDLEQMSNNSFGIAKQLLDYKTLARRMYG